MNSDHYEYKNHWTHVFDSNLKAGYYQALGLLIVLACFLAAYFVTGIYLENPVGVIVFGIAWALVFLVFLFIKQQKELFSNFWKLNRKFEQEFSKFPQKMEAVLNSHQISFKRKEKKLPFLLRLFYPSSVFFEIKETSLGVWMFKIRTESNNIFFCVGGNQKSEDDLSRLLLLMFNFSQEV